MPQLNLKEVREKYPQYHDLSDDKLVDGLHKKYYSDMPLDEFSKKVGYNKQGSDVGETIKGATQAGVSMVTGGIGALAGTATEALGEIPGTSYSMHAYVDQPNQKPMTSVELGDAVANELTYNPRSKAGQDMLKWVGTPESYANPMLYLQKISQAQQWVREKFKDSPHVQADVDLAFQALLAVGGGKALGGVLDKKLPAAPREIVNPKIRELREFGQAHDVDVLSYGQESGNPLAKGLEIGSKHAPFVGTGKFFQEGHKKAKAAAQGLADKFKTNGNYGEEIHESLKRGLSKAKNEAKSNFDDVEKKLLANGVVDKVGVDNLLPKVDELLKDYPDIFDRLPDKSLSQNIETIRAGVKRKEPQSQLVSIGGSRIKVTPEQAQRMGIAQPNQETALSFHEARFLRDKLSNYINRAQFSAGVVGNKEVHQLIELKNALDKDIESFGKHVGNQDVMTAFKKANDHYKENVVPFKDRLIDKATNLEVDTDTILKMFVKADRPKLAEKLYNRLDDEGKSAIKHGILKEAFDNAYDTRIDNFEPAKFSNELHKLTETNEIIFSPQEKVELDGWVKWMKAAEEFGKNQKITSKSESLTRLEPYGMAAGLLFAFPKSTLALGAFVKSSTLLLTSPMGKKILTELSKAPKNSVRYKDLVRQASFLAAQQDPALGSQGN